MSQHKTPKCRLSTSISISLRHRLEEAREVSGRTLTDEVEARLRDSLNATPSDGLVLLHIDHGLMAHLEALVRGGFYGPIEDTAIFMIRNGIIKNLENANLRELIVPHLPERFRKHFPEAARIYEAMAREPAQRSAQLHVVRPGRDTHNDG